jgi:hypothetical protein
MKPDLYTSIPKGKQEPETKENRVDYHSLTILRDGIHGKYVKLALTER